MAVMTFPDRQTVLDFLRENPSATTKQEIARGLKLKGKERTRFIRLFIDHSDKIVRERIRITGI